jgi:hypothetical protein
LKNRKEVVGAVVCGSYITGNPSKHSDVDVQILLDKKVKWRERGNKIIDGVLIEYFANPLPQNFKYFEDDYASNSRTNVHMFTTGRVLFDKNGDVKKIIEKANEWKKKEYKKMPKVVAELKKYSLWDMKDNLEEIYESGNDEFYFVYYNYLNSLFENYCKFLGFDNININKVRRFLTDKKDKKKYRINDFPDEKFVKLFLNALKNNEPRIMVKVYKELTSYVLNKMGKFNLDGWKIRSEVER